MRTIAERANVSVMTVSLALRNKGRMSAGTRERVLRIAEDLGYRPNPLVRSLMVNLRTTGARTAGETIAFLTSHPERDGWQKSLTSQRVYRGACRRAAELGFSIEIFWFGEPGMTGERMTRILNTRNIAGVLLAPLPMPGAAPDLCWDDLAAVAFGYSVAKPNVHRAANHHVHTIRIALNELHRRHYRRIGLVQHLSVNQRVDRSWSLGLLDYHVHLNVPAKDRIPPYLPEKTGFESFVLWFRKYRPDAIIGAATRAKPWLEQIGVKVPEEVGVATLDYDPEFGDMAGVIQNSDLVGAAGVDVVVEQLYHNERGLPRKPKVTMIEGEWREGPTVRPPPSDAAVAG